MTLFKHLKLVLPFGAFFFVCFLTHAQVAKTPPMGWNSYNCFGSAVHEDEVKANADYLAQNLGLLQGLGTTLSIYREAGEVRGVEYQTDVGPIDILAVGENGNYYVIELKLGRGPDAAVGQTLRYIAAIKKSLSKDATVFGVIVASSITDKLRYAASEVADRIFVMQYELKVTLGKVDVSL